jgi:CubicO group peptidase (beta-lactamase class C family)
MSASSRTPRLTGFAEVDQTIDLRVATEHLDGAALLVVANGTEVRRTGYGAYATDTVVPIASASKWLTTATLMTLVDEGRISLTDPVSKYLPQFTGPIGTATIRQLLSHTAGIAQANCIWEQESSLQSCVDSVAAEKPAYLPGARFSYGNTSFSVVGRVIEVVTGQSFEKAFESRIAGPLGMIHTRFDGYYYPTESNPVPAAWGDSTLDDYGRFVQMLANKGVLDGGRILSESSVLAMESDSVAGIDTHDDAAVRTTGIPTYGMGTWRDVVSSDDTGVITSGNGAYGFYPWVDRARNSYGVFLVFDERGSDLAVPESQAIVHSVWDALDGLNGAPTVPPTTTYGR